MILSEKEKIILNLLLKQESALSIKEIADLSKIKERTLYREIKNLELSLSRCDIQLVKEKSKYKILGDLDKINPAYLDTQIEQAYNQDTRINLILADLLLNSDNSIKDISEKFLISYNTVVSSLTMIEKILADYDIDLVRKKGQGISLKSKEEDKKILLLSILSNEISDEDFFSILNSTIDFSPNPFIKFLDLGLMRFVIAYRDRLDILNIYTDDSIKKILIALSVALNFSLNPKDYEQELMTKDERKLLEDLLLLVEQYQFLEGKTYLINYLAKILKSCKLIEELTYFNDKYSYTLIYKVHSLIKNISKKSGIDFISDKKLANGLVLHIESAIKRHQLKLIDENKELKEFVIKNYNELYLLVRSELIKIFDDIDFNGVELSYIVIHFASSYEQIYRENFIRALVVCSSGIGASKILGSLIRKNIPEIKNIEYSNSSKIKEDIKKNFDIIISTVKLDIATDYILIPTILRPEDITKIRESLGKVRSFKQQNDNNEEYNYKKYIHTILENTNQYVYKKEIKDLAFVLNEILNYNSNSFKHQEELVFNLLDRHNKASVLIPKTGVALFHTLDDKLEAPIISVVNLAHSKKMENSIGNPEKAMIFLLMISPNEKIYTNLLGQISIALINDKMLKTALQSANIDFIKTKIELILTQFELETKIND